MKWLETLVGAGILALASATASAAPINGSVSFAGGFEPNGTIGDGGTATAIDFDPDGGGTGTIVVTQSDGDFAANGVVTGTSGTITDFQFDPFSGPISDFWTLGEFSFDLEEITSVIFDTDAADIDKLAITGTGTIHGPGLDATSGVWGFTGQSATGATFSFSSTSAAEGVPAPGTLLVLGSGLVGLGFAARRRAT